jgi:hypothetical protein
MVEIMARAAYENIALWKVMQKPEMGFRNEEYYHGQNGIVYSISRVE